MSSYLLINILISCWALFIQRFIYVNVKIKFAITIIAITSWYIPFGILTFQSSIEIINTTQPVISTLTKPIELIIQQPDFLSFSWLYLLALAPFLGLIRFAFDLIQLHKQHQQFLQQGKKTLFHNIYTIKNLNNACVTGLKKPIIWIDESLFNSKLATSIIAHEQQHIASKDHYWILFITLNHRIFWFNPIIWLLVKNAKLNIEMRCDSACDAKCNKYQNQLAAILLAMNQKTKTGYNQMSHSPKNNLKRIQRLSMEKNMNNNFKWSFKISIFALLLMVLQVLAEPQSTSPPTLTKNQILLEVAFAFLQEAENHQLKKKNFSVIANHGKTATVKIDSFKIDMKPHIIQKENEETQILTELVVYDQNKNIISRPSLLIFNQKNAAMIIENDGNEDMFSIEITPTVGE